MADPVENDERKDSSLEPKGQKVVRGESNLVEKKKRRKEEKRRRKKYAHKRSALLGICDNARLS